MHSCSFVSLEERPIDLKTSTSDEEKRELQRRLEKLERGIQRYKGLVEEYESKANGYEEKLGLLKKEGECKIRQ